MVPKLFFRYPGDIIMELSNGPMGGAVFIGSHDGKVYAAARDSGRRLWQRDAAQFCP